MPDIAVYKFAIGISMDDAVVDDLGRRWLGVLYVCLARTESEALAFAMSESPYDAPWLAKVKPERIEIDQSPKFIAAARG